MRAGLSEVRETLTPECANILNQSIAEASRRTHGQTTPLHVTATLLSLPTGLLRQACVQNSTHPFLCRALELCFNVALEQLPAMAAWMEEPPLSNALAAAIRRAQLQQRQQKRLLAMKVEVSQLIISILDDPNVGRVVKEAGLQSSDVKSWVELYLVNSRGPSDRHVKPITDISDPAPICPQCSQNYEKESAKLTVIDNSSSPASLPHWLQLGATQPHNSTSQASLPHWLQLGATQPHSQEETDSLEKTQELHKKWRDTCLHLHQKKLALPNLLKRPIFKRKLHAMKPVKQAVQLDINSPPPSPVSTDLVLGQKPVGKFVKTG